MFNSTLIVVVFPAPFAPIIANALPSGTSKLNPRSASKRPNLLQRFSMRIIGSLPPRSSPALPIAPRSPPLLRGDQDPDASPRLPAVPLRAATGAFGPRAEAGESPRPPFQFQGALRASAPGSNAAQLYALYWGGF